jgi:hypothetical protein
MLVIVFIPWLMWGLVIHTERLHDRDTSAWWLLLFYGLPALLGPLAKLVSFAGGVGVALQYVLTLAGLALSIWGIYRNRLPARHRRIQRLRSQSNPAGQARRSLELDDQPAASAVAQLKPKCRLAAFMMTTAVRIKMICSSVRVVKTLFSNAM